MKTPSSAPETIDRTEVPPSDRPLKKMRTHGFRRTAALALKGRRVIPHTAAEKGLISSISKNPDQISIITDKLRAEFGVLPEDSEEENS